MSESTKGEKVSEVTKEEMLKWVDEELNALSQQLRYLINEAMKGNDERRNHVEKICRENIMIMQAIHCLIENMDKKPRIFHGTITEILFSIDSPNNKESKLLDYLKSRGIEIKEEK